MDDGKVFQEVDLMSVLHEIGTKNKTLNAKVLSELEKYITNEEDFKLIRSFILDEQNSYTRSIVRLIFGEVEFMNFSKR